MLALAFKLFKLKPVIRIGFELLVAVLPVILRRKW